MILKIKNMTGIIYGWFIGLISMIPNMVYTFSHLSSEWIFATFYIGCMVLIIPFILERHRSIQLLGDSFPFILFYKREIIIAISLIILSFMPKFLVLSYIIGAYHLYWLYNNYSILAVKVLKGK